jgi:histidine triad (HIT) family protein
MDTSCVFCQIAAGGIPATLVLDTPTVVAFRDVNPQAPAHVLVVPRRHVTGLTELASTDGLWNELIGAAQAVTAQLGMAEGFRVVVNQGEAGGQTVPHLHLHVLAGRQMGWPPG